VASRDSCQTNAASAPHEVATGARHRSRTCLFARNEPRHCGNGFYRREFRLVADAARKQNVESDNELEFTPESNGKLSRGRRRA
jgi:hypothetical protein